ncbi:hypothetical protein MHBO_000112 [Bonamia ostreae]|uniref:SDR family oxidoreductase n=1 Tax=Bonamia ostreae TaxID=126728 RepID=A0ABV2AEH8_9EUKA
MTLTYFIAGASRGIGFEFVKQLLASSNVVIAGCRNTESLSDLKSKYPKNLHTLTLDVNSDSSIDNAYEDLNSKTKQNLKIDVFVHSAGVDDFTESVFDIKRKTARKVFETNSISPLMVSRKFLDMFNQPASKLIFITSLMSSISDNTHSSGVFYRMSKTALNMLAKCLSIDLKERGVTVLAIHPGWVQTDMGKKGGLPPLTPEQSVKSMINVISSLKPDQTGQFLSWKGDKVEW